MAEVKKFGVQEILARAESDVEQSKFSSNLLGQSLKKAVSSLSLYYAMPDPFIPEDKSGEYAKMFGAIAEDFRGLSTELSKMRSSYLPYELVEGVLEEINTGVGKKIEEIIDVESVLESYENTFFRLLGMPSTSDLATQEPLVSVSVSGTLQGPEFDLGNLFTMTTLDIRQTGRRYRPHVVPNSVYDFLTSSISSMQRLEDTGFSKIAEITYILESIKFLYNYEKIDETSTRVAEDLHSYILKNNSLPEAESGAQLQDLSSLPVHFSKETDWGAGPAMVMEAGYYLSVVFEHSLKLLHPELANSYTPDLIKSLWNEHVLKQPDVSMMSLNEPGNFWMYSYLLFPPVQDGRIAKCINEPEKMVAEPFLPKNLRVVNGNPLKSTLLEAVIRIRLDVISGTNSSPSPDGLPITSGASDAPLSWTDIREEMGLLESLVIVRLFSALYGFAIDAKKKIKTAHSVQLRNGIAPDSNSNPDSDVAKDNPVRKKPSKERLALQALQTIEESLLLLFGDNSVPEALELQEGVARNAGVRDSHLMSSVLSIIDVPKRWADDRISKLNEQEARASDGAGDKSTKDLRTKLGIAKGVGALDVLAFLIAMFTAEEKILLALLTDQQFEYLKLEYPEGFFDDLERDKYTMAYAVNDIALRAYDAYQLFRYALKFSGGNFRYPVIEDYENATETTDTRKEGG